MAKLKEEWKVIGNYPEYSVSNLGKIKKRLIKNQSINNKGECVTKFTEGDSTKVHLVKRIVVETFVGKLEKNQIVYHKDGNKLNNKVSNLAVGYKTNITDEDVLFIRSNAKKSGGDIKQSQLAREYGVTEAAISKIVNGINRK